ncbi:MAG: hypothetical protein GY749_31150 [Desulfobacteraceae bacterium]|nr:hypothetical protein [Desulfobacteraceae bacterium]
MTNPLHRQKLLQKKPCSIQQTPYQRLYGLRENPFPALALFAPGANDPRRDGTIYDLEFRRQEEKKFFNLFIQPPAGDEPLQLGFVRVDHSAGGRGNGKSVFLHHIAERINKQDTQDLFALAVHVLPDPHKQKRFWQFIYLIFETLANKGLFSDIDINFRAALLIRLLSEEQISEVSEIPTQDIRSILLSDDRFEALLKKYNLTMQAFIEEAERQVKSVAGQTLNEKFLNEFSSAKCSMVQLWKKWREHGFAPNSYQWRKIGINLFTDGFVPMAIAAGYRRLYLLLDEFEKIYIYQNNRERDEFLDSLRQYFYERNSAGLRNKYIITILTIHPSIDRYLATNWQRVGLDHMAPLDPTRMAECSVELGESTPENLSRLLTTYIDFFREQDSDSFNPLYPFSDDALEPAILKAWNYPRGALWYAYAILKKAAEEEIPAPISRSYVDALINAGMRPLEDEDEIILNLPSLSKD